MKLFLLYALSDLLLEEILIAQTGNKKAVVVCLDEYIRSKLDSMGISSFLVLPKQSSQKEHDKWFAEKFMPGVFGNTSFLGTTLPIWKVMSIDRLRFWALNWEVVREFIDNFNPEEIVVPLDYYHPFILEHKNITAIKTHEVIDPISRDILSNFPVKKIIVATDREKEFVKGIVGRRVNVESRKINRTRPVITEAKRNAHIQQFGKRDRVILFEKQHTWLLGKIKDKSFTCLDKRSEGILLSHIPGAEILTLEIASFICDNISFLGGYNEGVYWRIPQHVKVSAIDPHDMNTTSSIPLPEGVSTIDG